MKFYRIVKENLKTNKKRCGVYVNYSSDVDRFNLEVRVKELNKNNKVKAVVYYVEERNK